MPVTQSSAVIPPQRATLELTSSATTVIKLRPAVAFLILAPKTFFNPDSKTSTADRVADDRASLAPVLLSDHAARDKGESDEEICDLHAGGLRRGCGDSI
jgi:hypothetical protein